MDILDMDRVNEIVREKQFELGALEPISWKSISYNLKHAADRLFEIYYSADRRQISRFIEEARSGIPASGG